jgi:hypothetical protein
MKCKFLLPIVFMMALSACKKDKANLSDLVRDHKPVTTSTSFDPMQIGNYWKTDDQDYTEIQDTLRIGGYLYYKFFSLIGGDGVVTQYLRIDDNQNLVEALPSDTTFHYLHAKFNANVNDTFNTITNQNANNFQGTVIYKSDTKISFRYNSTFPSGNSTTFVVTYYKGIGPDGNYKTIKINGIVYNY